MMESRMIARVSAFDGTSPSDQELESAGTLSLRKLSGEDISSYLHLRSRILNGELNWTNPAVESTKDLLDKYDEYSSSFGIFRGSTLIAGIRLILSKSLEDLPSAQFLGKQPVHWSKGAFAEISRGMVSIEFRHLGLLTLLVRRCLAEAYSLGVRNVIASVSDTPKARALMAKLGFSPICDGFIYHDRYIQPSAESVLLQLDSTRSLHLTEPDLLFSSIQDEMESLCEMIGH